MTKSARALILGVFLCLASFAMDSVALAQQLWVPCKPVETAAFSNRIHVRCATQVDGRFWYFAAPTSDARLAARTLSVIEAAQLGDKFLNILIDATDQSGPAFGCLASDCRPIIAVAMLETASSPPGRCAFDNNRTGCPGFCAAHPNDRSCPGYCAQNPNDRTCPQYCTTHPNDITCPGYCRRHPQDTVNCDVCAGPNASHNPQCQ